MNRRCRVGGVRRCGALEPPLWRSVLCEEQDITGIVESVESGCCVLLPNTQLRSLFHTMSRVLQLSHVFTLGPCPLHFDRHLIHTGVWNKVFLLHAVVCSSIHLDQHRPQQLSVLCCSVCYWCVMCENKTDNHHAGRTTKHSVPNLVQYEPTEAQSFPIDTSQSHADALPAVVSTTRGTSIRRSVSGAPS